MKVGVKSALLSVGIVLAGAAAAVGYGFVQIGKPAKGNPREYRHRARWPSQRVTVCLGASIVHARVSVDFVEMLRERLPADEYLFVNAGQNGDLAYNALRRLDSVMACDPDFVVILVGTNDVQCTLSERIKRMVMRGGTLPCEPSMEWYQENMAAMLRQLGEKTRARVAVCSLPVLGEDLRSLANQRIEEFNRVIKQVCEEDNGTYLPVHERQAAYLVESGRMQGPGYTDNAALVMAAALQHYLLGWSFDRISKRNGLALTTDRIHLNSAGAEIVLEEVEKFLSGQADSGFDRAASLG